MMCVAAAVQSEVGRSLSLPENRLTANLPLQQAVSSSSSSVIAAVEEKLRRTSIDSSTAAVAAATPQSAADRTSAPPDVKTPHDVTQSPGRSVRPTRLDLPLDDRKHPFGILLNRSPRRTKNPLASPRCVVICISVCCYLIFRLPGFQNNSSGKAYVLLQFFLFFLIQDFQVPLADRCEILLHGQKHV